MRSIGLYLHSFLSLSFSFFLPLFYIGLQEFLKWFILFTCRHNYYFSGKLKMKTPYKLAIILLKQTQSLF